MHRCTNKKGFSDSLVSWAGCIPTFFSYCLPASKYLIMFSSYRLKYMQINIILCINKCYNRINDDCALFST